MKDLLKQTLDIKTVVLLIVAIGGAVWVISSQWTSVNDQLATIDKRLTRIESALSIKPKPTNGGVVVLNKPD